MTEQEFFDDCFIACYIHSAKEYCDESFFKNLFESNIGNTTVSVVDNSIGLDYFNRLNNIIYPYHKNTILAHIDVRRDDPRHQFLINVTESVTELRKQFLATNKKYFIILETDVFPRDKNWLLHFSEVIDKAEMIGGLYYVGFHGQELWDKEAELVYTVGMLSGCTLYKRDVIENFPFRWSMENEGAFPDAWISHDSNCDTERSWPKAMYTKIKCDHKHNEHGGRGHDKIN